MSITLNVKPGCMLRFREVHGIMYETIQPITLAIRGNLVVSKNIVVSHSVVDPTPDSILPDLFSNCIFQKNRVELRPIMQPNGDAIEYHTFLDLSQIHMVQFIGPIKFTVPHKHVTWCMVLNETTGNRICQRNIIDVLDQEYEYFPETVHDTLQLFGAKIPPQLFWLSTPVIATIRPTTMMIDNNIVGTLEPVQIRITHNFAYNRLDMLIWQVSETTTESYVTDFGLTPDPLRDCIVVSTGVLIKSPNPAQIFQRTLHEDTRLQLMVDTIIEFESNMNCEIYRFAPNQRRIAAHETFSSNKIRYEHSSAHELVSQINEIFH